MIRVSFNNTNFTSEKEEKVIKELRFEIEYFKKEYNDDSFNYVSINK